MELAQLKEAGSSQAGQRAAAEESVAKATAKVERVKDVVSEKTELCKEANSEWDLFGRSRTRVCSNTYGYTISDVVAVFSNKNGVLNNRAFFNRRP